MDQRLLGAYGLRPHRLTKESVPALALAIVAYYRRQAYVDRLVVQDTLCIRLFNKEAGIDVLVRSDDWAKIVPYLKDGTFDTLVVPVLEPVVLNPGAFRDASTLDIHEKQLYERVVGVLEKLFTVEFPTSD